MDAPRIVPLERPVGMFQVDNNGSATFIYPIEICSGIGAACTPKLSLNYRHGGNNGLLGIGWSLAGCDAIQRMAKTLASDGANGPIKYESNATRFAFQGSELLSKTGFYGMPQTLYGSEIETGVTVLDTGNGFHVKENNGTVREYGVTGDSRATSQNGKYVREWWIKQITDLHGNRLLYNYTHSPKLEDGSAPLPDNSISYLDSIEYSYPIAGTLANKFVSFQYEHREDAVVITGAGDSVKMSYRLKRILVSIVHSATGDREHIPVRSYLINYDLAPNMHVSWLTSITEQDISGDSLPPTSFTYTGSIDKTDSWFSTPQSSAPLHGTDDVGNRFILPLNIAGNGLTDIGCVAQSPQGRITVTSYIADVVGRASDDSMLLAWPAANSTTQPLPTMKNEHLIILPTDLNGDGRSDLIVPYEDDASFLKFAILRSTGSGFEDGGDISTGTVWNSSSRFLALDSNGNHTIDVVQIDASSGEIVFRVFFFEVAEIGSYKLKDIVESRTFDYDTGTKQWLVMDSTRDGVQDLVRIWADVDGDNFWATAYIGQVPISQRTTYVKMGTIKLGSFTSAIQSNMTILPCDINGDGVQDLVVCQVEPDESVDYPQLKIAFQIFLCDGIGGFLEQPKQPSQSFQVESYNVLSSGRFSAMDVDRSGLPSITYIYTDSKKDWHAIVVQGTYSGEIKGFTAQTIVKATQLPPGEVNLTPADVNGTGKGGWIAWSLENNTFNMIPIYNVRPLSGLMKTITDPLGQGTSITYRSLSDPIVYKPSTRAIHPASLMSHEVLRALSTTLPAAGPYVSVFGNTDYVVSQIDFHNVPHMNACPFSSSIQKLYEAGRVDLDGRGWLGFARVQTLQRMEPQSVLIETFSQEWPCSGYKIREELFGKADDAAVFEVESFSSEINLLLRMEDWEYSVDTIPTPEGIHKFYHIKKSREEICLYDNGTAAKRIGHEYTYDADNNLSLDKTYTIKPGATVREYQLWERYSYTTIDEVHGLLVAYKSSSRDNNCDMARFELGDLALNLFTIDRASKDVAEKKEFSTSHNDFLLTQYAYDIFGNLTLETRPCWENVNLVREIIYDPEYHSHPLVETWKGPGVNHTKLYAFDARFGTKVSERASDGSLTVVELDTIGRVCKRMINGLAHEGGNIISKEILKYCTATPGFETTLLSTDFVVMQTVDYHFDVIDAQSRWMRKTEIVNFAQEQQETTSLTSSEYLDCRGISQKSCVSAGDHFSQTWTYKKTDGKGNTCVESPPKFLPKEWSLKQKLEWIPKPDECKRVIFDGLSRPVQEITPRDNNSVAAVTRIQYILGGDKVITTIASLVAGSTLTILKTLVTQHETILGMSKLVETTNEAGLTSSFTYDQNGQLQTAIDPSSKIETTIHDNFGNLLSINNDYQNQSTGLGPAQQMIYNKMNLVTEVKDISGNTVSIKYDVRGRMTQRVTSSDHRTIDLLYDATPSAIGHLSRAIVSLPGSMEPESRVDFVYDARGRPTSSTLSLCSGDTYETRYIYDFLDRLVSKTLPDGTQVSIERSGTLEHSVTMKSSNSQAWSLEAVFSDYSAAGQLQEWAVTGTGGTTANFNGSIRYDSLGRPVDRKLSSGETRGLVWESYGYDIENRLTRSTENYSGDTTTYTYKNDRLSGSISANDQHRLYDYDKSGNVTNMSGMTIAYAPRTAVGVENGHEVFRATYDVTGKMTSRMAQRKSCDFTYNGFGTVHQIIDRTTEEVGTITTDFLGNTLTYTMPDGSKRIKVTTDFEVTKHKDGAATIRKSLFSPRQLLAIVTSHVPKGNDIGSSTANEATFYFSNTKGTTTHQFGADGTLQNRLLYDDFGLLLSRETFSSDALQYTYEGRTTYHELGLLDFGPRLYDPVIGRFTTPDDRWSGDAMIGRDVSNRYAFENNDPINNIDPTGHWSWSAWAGVFIGLALVVAAVVVTALTAGTGAPLAFLGLSALWSGVVTGG